jgi:hypothetical protein
MWMQALEIMTIQQRLVFDVESCVLLASTLFHIEFIQTFHLSTCVFNQ